MDGVNVVTETVVLNVGGEFDFLFINHWINVNVRRVTRVFVHKATFDMDIGSQQGILNFVQLKLEFSVVICLEFELILLNFFNPTSLEFSQLLVL